jgi:hypothetical protein
MQNPYLPPGVRQSDLDDRPRRSTQEVLDHQAARGQYLTLYNECERMVLLIARGQPVDCGCRPMGCCARHMTVYGVPRNYFLEQRR